eukprot:CAMPEP_0167749902 /NCGR_PEP_ID=MMETSP0110_2-20121227/5682_1 /TAXON_ID=629695 /ORGANISM="Gymnochlora sp., Strain CCMP2014" /LENGTH=486 /DNA_ID=CAMNT_0007635141 /DNA_START=144 /DNA_END=1604 /DNA_ORIENTATION=+
MASLGVSLFTYRQERTHHHEARKLEMEHHKVMLDIEKRLHDEQIDLSKKAVAADVHRHEENVKLSKDLQAQSIALENRLHQAQLCSALEQHLQDITSDLVVAGKEADRDMWDQRNAQYQTLLLSATVMFAAGMAVIVEGELPSDTSTLLIIGYSGSVGCSFASLFVSIILCIRIVVSMSTFMYNLTNHHQTVVTNLVLKASDVMNELFNIQDTATRMTSTSHPGRKKDKELDAKEIKERSKNYNKLLQQLSVKRREINRYLARQYLNKRLVKYDIIKPNKGLFGSQAKRSRTETKLRAPGKSTLPQFQSGRELKRQGTLQRCESRPYLRDLKIQESRDDRRNVYREWSDFGTRPTFSRQETGLPEFQVDESQVPRMTEFEAFWHQHLKFAARFARISFYTGTIFLLFAISFLIFARFTLTLKSKVGAYTFISFVGASLILGVIVSCLPAPNVKYQRSFPSFTETEKNGSRESNGADSPVPGHVHTS